MPWKNRSTDERKVALTGATHATKSAYKESFSPGERKFMEISYKANSSAFFRDIHNSDPADWLLNHKEDGQSYEEFASSPSANGDSKLSSTYSSAKSLSRTQRKTIYILPLGPFPTCRDLMQNKKYGKAFANPEYSSDNETNSNPLLLWLKTYCSYFFYSANVSVLPPVSIKQVACHFRVNEFTGRYQLNASDILSYLRKIKTSSQHCLVAVTMIDLYPRPSWNFVFGLASTSKTCFGGVGVFSFCRYDDRFYETWTLGEDVMKTLPDGSLDYSVFSEMPKSLDGTPHQIDGMLLLRACKVMTHEVGHMFGLKHCIWMQCLMNGTNHLQESDRRPPHLCPVCLRKLQAVLNFQVLDRYKALYRWTREEEWNKKDVDAHVEAVESPKIPKKDKPEKKTISAKENSQIPKLLPSFMQPTKSTIRKKSREITKPSENRIRRTINGRPVQKKIPLSINRYSHQSRDDKLHNGELTGIPVPPVEDFASYRIWLREAIEFIISNGKPSFVSTPEED